MRISHRVELYLMMTIEPVKAENISISVKTMF